MFPAPNLDVTFSEQQGRKQDGAGEDATGIRGLTTPGKTADFGPACSLSRCFHLPAYWSIYTPTRPNAPHVN